MRYIGISRNFGARIVEENMRLLKLAFLVVLSFVCQTRAAQLLTPKACQTQLTVESISVGGVEIPVPLGISTEPYLDFLETLANPELEVTAAIFYGSRTHFSYGYPPKANSDQDLRIYYEIPPFGFSGARSTYQEILSCLRTYSRHESFPINTQIVSHSELAEELTGYFTSRGTFRKIPDAGVEERLFAQAAESAETSIAPLSTRKAYRQLLGSTRGSRFIIGKEAIIILFPHRNREKHLQILKKHGYRHVFSLKKLPQ